MAVARVRKVTGADVARAAGVSRATVSYVLNDTPGQTIPEATREAVRQAASGLGYRPNPAARRLAGGRGGHVLMLVPAIRTGDQVNAIAWRLTRLLAVGGIALSLAYDLVDLPSIARLARSTGADRILALRAFTSAERAQLEALGVSLRDLDDGPAAGWNEFAGRKQVDHLHELGRRRLAYARPSESGLDDLVTRREAGALAAIRGHGLADPPTAEFAVDGSNAAEVVAGWISAGIDGVVAYNDEVALRVLHGVRLAGYSCPHDLAIIGVDDLPAGQVAFPPLSTVALSPDRFAELLAVELLPDADHVPHVATEPLSDLIHVVPRASTAAHLA